MLQNLILWILPFLVKTSAVHFADELFSSIIEIVALPPPITPLKFNISDILKKMPSPSQALRENDDGHSSKAVELLRNSLNESVNPCEDFYEFTCGKWLANNQIPKGEKFLSHFNDLSKRVKDQLYELFVDSKPSSSKSINQAKSMFKACMTYDRKKQSVLLERINKFGGWPILRGSEWDPECSNLSHLLGKMLPGFEDFLSMSNILVSVYAWVDQQNASRKAIFINQGMLGLGMGTSKLYRNDTKMEEYKQRIMGMVKVLASDAGTDINDEKLIDGVQKIVDFEKELANITTNFPSLSDNTFKRLRLSDLNKLLPGAINFFKALLTIRDTFHQYLASDPQMYVSPFVYRLVPILRKTDKRTLVNYVILRYVMEWSNRHLDDRLEHKKEAASERNFECIEVAVKAFIQASQAIYVRKYFDNDSKIVILGMVENIRNAFRAMLGHNAWMDPVTKKRAISKLDKALALIGFPDFILNDSTLDAYYDELIFDANESYPSMFEKTSKFLTAKKFQTVLEPTDHNALSSYPIYVVNANFFAPYNVIRVMAGMLQAPLFDKSFPNSMNYGAIGSLIGHEFTHGFDSHGSTYNEQGYKRNWWTPETKSKFQKQKQCIINQYSAFHVPELNMTVNGTRTEFENMADNGGIKEAYMAYQAYKKKLGHEEKPLNGMDRFTNEQLFFISYGQTWCEKVTKEWNMQPNEHAPGRARVNVVVSNMPQFSTAFQCPQGSPMNPAKKCQVW